MTTQTLVAGVPAGFFSASVAQSDPCVSSTARETMFSEAISSIWSCWRRSSPEITAPRAGSESATDAEKKPAGTPAARDCVIMRPVLRIRRDRTRAVYSLRAAGETADAGSRPEK